MPFTGGSKFGKVNIWDVTIIIRSLNYRPRRVFATSFSPITENLFKCFINERSE